MKPKLTAIAFWLFLFAGVLYFLAGLRDVFAPGFFNVSPHIPSRGDILLNFLLAFTFLAMGVLMRKTQTNTK